MKDNTIAVIFEGGELLSELEKSLNNVRHTVLLENMNKIIGIDGIKEIIVVTNYDCLAKQARKMDRVIVKEVKTKGFHFGGELLKIVSGYKPQNLLYVGGASFPLIQENEIEQIISTVKVKENFVYTNNPQSSDLVAFTPADAVFNMHPPASDNSLAISLRDEAGLKMELIPYSKGIIFDLDTPTDFLILGASPYVEKSTEKALREVPLNYELLDKAKEVLCGYYRDVAIVGRVGAPLIAYLNNNLKLRLRIFSEERGMKALGRESSGEVESLIGFFIEEFGISKFFKYLERVAELAFIDTRVLFAHFKLDLQAEERFLSDMGRWQEIANPWLKEFTRTAVECEIPVLLGGHSLVSGGLWLLAEELKMKV